MPQFSANLSMLFTEYPLCERVQQAAQAGFEAVEIQFPYAENPQQLKAALENARMPLNLINIPAGDLMTGGDGLACVPTKEHEFRQAVQTALAWAKELSVPQLNLLAGRQPMYCDLSASLKTFTQNARFAANACAAAGVRLLIEAINPYDMPRFLVANMAQLLDVLESINHDNVFAQFDCYHIAKTGDDVAKLLTEHISIIKHIQFADYPHRHEPNTGTLDFAALFTLVDSLDYTGYMAAEYRPSKPTAQTLNWLN